MQEIASSGPQSAKSPALVTQFRTNGIICERINALSGEKDFYFLLLLNFLAVSASLASNFREITCQLGSNHFQVDFSLLNTTEVKFSRSNLLFKLKSIIVSLKIIYLTNFNIAKIIIYLCCFNFRF